MILKRDFNNNTLTKAKTGKHDIKMGFGNWDRTEASNLV
jgi:hypothetical protein